MGQPLAYRPWLAPFWKQLGWSQKSGRGGIRTLERLTPQHEFQSCALNRSATRPPDFATVWIMVSTV